MDRDALRVSDLTSAAAAIASGATFSLETGPNEGRYMEEQIVYALRQVEQGAPLTQVCRRKGVSPTTFHL